MTEQRHWLLRTGIGIAAVLLVASCGTGPQAGSGGDDKAGGDADPVVLTMADATDPGHPAVQHFIDQVAELSGGSLRIDVTNEWGSFANDAAQQVVRDTAAGEADLAWVWTHAFDTLEIDAFRSLNAPMLIDSYALQEAVIGSDIPAEMLAELDAVGVTGIAVLADGIYKPFAVEGPLLSPADYDGITFTHRRSTTLEEAILALGENPRVAIAHDRTTGLTRGEIQGFEMNLSGYAGGAGQLQYLAPYGTANTNLWANPIALIASPESLADLTDTQREWVMQAGAAASERSSDLVDDDAQLVAQLCETGARFGNASEADMAAMHQAFEPVYTMLERDAQTAEFITRIASLKADIDPEPALNIPAGCTGPSPLATPEEAATSEATGDQTVLDGTYRWTITRDEAVSVADTIPEIRHQLATTPWIFTATLGNGLWTLRVDDAQNVTSVECDISDECSYAIDGDRVAFDWFGSVLEFTFTADENSTLQLHPAGPMPAGDVFVWTTKPWQRID
jgi:TRAP-type C4-dicarboxylate transport system substrate-binding protein